jgi:hypothetical protein
MLYTPASYVQSCFVLKTPFWYSLYVATSPDIEKKNIRGAYFKPSATLPAPFIRPAICTPSAKARDATLATKLWQLSERLVGLSK